MYFTPKRLKLYLGALLVLEFCTLLSGIPILRSRNIDFRAPYTAGYMLRTGHAAQLYDYPTEQRLQSTLVRSDPNALPFMPPPFAALFFIPLSYLSFIPACAIFAAINILLLLASWALVKPFLPELTARWKPAPLLLFLSFIPAAITLIMGQLSFLLLVLYCACFVALRRNQNLLAGFLLSLALIKFQIALPIAVLFLLWRQWRVLSGFLLGGTLLTALSIRITGAEAFLGYLHSLYTMTHSITPDLATQAHFGITPSFMPNLFGALFLLSHGAPWGRILTLALSLALFLWTARQRPSLPLALLTAMLVSYHLFFYDLTLLLLPLALLADHLLSDSAPSPNRRLLVTQISLGALLLGPLMRLLISDGATYLVALPILALTLSSAWWPSLQDPRHSDALAESATELAAPPVAT